MINELEILFLCSVLIIIIIYHARLNYIKRKNTNKDDKIFLNHGISSINYCILTPILRVFLITIDLLAIYIYDGLLKDYPNSNIIIIMLLLFKVTLVFSSFLLLNISLYPVSEIKHTLEINNNNNNNNNDKLKISFFKTLFFYGLFCFIWDLYILYLIDMKLLFLNIIICPIIFYLGMGDALEHPKLDKKRNILVRHLTLLKSHITSCFKFLINKNYRQTINAEAIYNIKLIFKALYSLYYK